MAELYSPPLIQAQSWEEAQRKFNEALRQLSRMLNDIYTGANIPNTRLVAGTKIDGIEEGADATAAHAGEIVFYSDTAPEHIIGRLWFDTINNYLKRSTGTSWQVVGDETALHQGLIVIDNIADGTTYGKIKLDALDDGLVDLLKSGVLNKLAKVKDILLDTTGTTWTLATDLDGDTDQLYLIIIFLRCGYSGYTTFNMRINNDSAAKYGWQTAYCVGAGATGATYTGQTSWAIATCDTLDEVAQMTMFLYAKSGRERIANAMLAREIAGTTVDVADIVGYTFNDVSSNITRFDIIADQANGIKAGSHVIMYRIN